MTLKTILMGLRNRLYRRRKLDWTTLTPSQKQMFLAIKQKQERYRKLKVVK